MKLKVIEKQRNIMKLQKDHKPVKVGGTPDVAILFSKNEFQQEIMFLKYFGFPVLFQ